MQVPARFPDEIWNGRTGNRSSLSEDKECGSEDFDRLAAEIIALQNFIQPVICRAATTEALSCAIVGDTLVNNDVQAALVIDGVTMAVGDLVLVKDQDDLTVGVKIVTNIGSNATNWVLKSYGRSFVGMRVIVTGGITNNNTFRVQTQPYNFSLN